MKTYASVIHKLALVLLLLGSLGMILSTVLGFSDVVGTQFLDFPVPGTLEITESTMVLIVFGALAYTQSKRGHIRVEIVYNYFSPRGKAMADFFTHLIAFLYFALMAWEGINEAQYSWQIGEATMGTIRFPLFPARCLLVAGTVLLLLQLVVDLVEDARRVTSGGVEPEAQHG